MKWTLDMLRVASLMRQNPSLNIALRIAAYRDFESIKDADMASATAMIRSMDAQQFEKLAFVHLCLFHRFGIAGGYLEDFSDVHLCILLKGSGTEEDLHELGFGVRFGINVIVKWGGGGSESNTDQSDSGEDDSESDNSEDDSGSDS
jgi:hypothetical protein